MPLGLLAIIASIPVLAVLVLMVGFRWPASKTMPVAWLIAVLLAVLVWNTPPNYLLAATVRGINAALEILLIVFGALVLLFTLREAGALNSINRGLQGVSRDRRVQAILISWLFGAFLEGAAGFGVPAALVSPLLVTLGFPALAAVMVSLIANATPVSFGPVGVPTILGLGTALNTIEVQNALLDHHLTFPQFIYQIGVWTALFHATMAVFVPLLAVAMMTKFFGANRTVREGLRIWPFALFAGLSFTIPYLLTAWYLGPEFPSLFGGLVGMIIVLPAAKFGFLMPGEAWEFPVRAAWGKNWRGSVDLDDARTGDAMRLWKAWLPYVMVGLLLVVTRISLFPVGAYLRSIPFAMDNLFGTDVKTRLEPAYNPGLIAFIVVALFSIPFYSLNSVQVRRAWREAGVKIRSPLVALLFTVPMVEVMQAGHSPHGWESMPIVVAHSISQLSGHAWPLIAPYVGAFGAFIAGSNTVSNMLFGLFQYSVAETLRISRTLTLSLQNVGGSFGVLICVFKIIAACATVGLTGVEGLLIRRNILPLLIYGTVVGVVGLVVVYWVNPALF